MFWLCSSASWGPISSPSEQSSCHTGRFHLWQLLPSRSHLHGGNDARFQLSSFLLIAHLSYRHANIDKCCSPCSSSLSCRASFSSQCSNECTWERFCPVLVSVVSAQFCWFALILVGLTSHWYLVFHLLSISCLFLVTDHFPFPSHSSFTSNHTEYLLSIGLLGLHWPTFWRLNWQCTYFTEGKNLETPCSASLTKRWRQRGTAAQWLSSAQCFHLCCISRFHGICSIFAPLWLIVFYSGSRLVCSPSCSVCCTHELISCLSFPFPHFCHISLVFPILER